MLKSISQNQYQRKGGATIKMGGGGGLQALKVISEKKTQKNARCIKKICRENLKDLRYKISGHLMPYSLFVFD